LGKQDMTSHVNFTALVQKGDEVGLRFAGLVPQYRFLLALGLLQETESMEKVLSTLNGLKLRLSLKHLIESESGMGEIFKVLIQHKGVGQPQLMGLRDLDTVPWPA
jgi:SAM-dependent MidA family methyltransferase